MHSFMQEDLIPYLYGEASVEQSNAIKTALETDWILKEKYEELVAAQRDLGSYRISPRKEAIDFILNYATKSIGEFSVKA